MVIAVSSLPSVCPQRTKSNNKTTKKNPFPSLSLRYGHSSSPCHCLVNGWGLFTSHWPTLCMHYAYRFFPRTHPPSARHAKQVILSAPSLFPSQCELFVHSTSRNTIIAVPWLIAPCFLCTIDPCFQSFLFGPLCATSFQNCPISSTPTKSIDFLHGKQRQQGHCAFWPLCIIATLPNGQFLLCLI